MANNICENKDVKNRHVDLKTVSESPWYKYLGADRLVSSDTSNLSSAQVYIYNKELQSDQLKDFRCLQLDGDMILHFPFDTTAYDYYIKSYKVDETSKRLKYTSLKTRYNLIQINDGSNATIPAGKYGLNGWDILAVSKNDMPFYRYKDGTNEQEYLYARGSTHFVEDIIKDKTINKNEVIINDTSRIGKVAEYEVPGYYGIGNPGRAKTITLFGNIKRMPEEREEVSFNQPIVYGNESSTAAKMINQTMRPYILFEDFGEYPDSNNIPSNTYPLRYVYNYDKATKHRSCTISFRGQEISIPLYSDDKVILYIREPINADNIIAAGCRLIYHTIIEKDFDDAHKNSLELVISSTLYDSSLIENTSNFLMLVQGQHIKTYDITNTNWSANNTVQCDKEKMTNDFQEIIEKHNEIISFDEKLDSDPWKKSGMYSPFINTRRNQYYFCSCGKISLKDYGKFIGFGHYNPPSYTCNNIKNNKTIIFNDIPYIVHKPKFTKLLSEETISSKQNNDKSINVERIFNTNIESTLGVIKSGNLSAKYYSFEGQQTDFNGTPDIPTTGKYDARYAEFNTTADYDIQLDRYKEMNRQGFNQIVTTEGVRSPFKSSAQARINQPACAIVLWRRHTNEPITEKIEKLS